MSEARCLVIGLGNPLMGDDGFGLAALARFVERWETDDRVVLLDGGTWGMNLLPDVESAEAVVFIDAVNVRQSPGTPVTLERHELPKLLALKLSPHQIGIQEVLALAELRGRLPERTVVIGTQPAYVEMSTALSGACAAVVDLVAERVAGRLEAWGYAVREREAAACTR